MNAIRFHYSIMAAMLGLFFYLAVYLLQYPYYGINVSMTADGQWAVQWLDPSRDHTNIQLEIGDVILEVDGKKPVFHHSIRDGALEQFHQVTVSRHGATLSYILNPPRKLGQTDRIAIFGFLISSILSEFIFQKLRQTQSGLHLSLLFAIIATIFVSFIGSIRLIPAGQLSIIFFLSSIPIEFACFFHILFKEKGIHSINFSFTRWLWLVPSLMLSMAVYNFFNKDPWTHTIIGNIGILLFCLGILLNLGMLAYAAYRYRGQRSYEATLIRSIWASLCISLLPLAALSLVPSLILHNSIGLVDPIYTGYCVLFFPASFAYLIGTNQLYDIQLVILRLGISAVISLLPSALLVGLVRSLAPQVPLARLLLLGSFVVLLFTFVLYALEYFTNKLVPIMFPRRHQLSRSLRNIAKRLGPVSNLKGLKDIVLLDLVSTLQVHGGAIVFRYRDGSAESIAVGAINAEQAEQLVSEGVVEHTHYTSFEITSHEAFTAYLVMTRKKSNTLLGQEEVQWLRLIMTYLSVTLENIHLIRKLTAKVESAELGAEEKLDDAAVARELENWGWLRKLSFELQERERTRIANDLHDTTMQDLFFMKRRLVSLLDKGALAPDDTAELEELAEFTEIVNTNLRQSCFELHPHVLREAGLLAALEKLVRQEEEAGSFDIGLALDDAGSAEALDLEAKRHLFRIVQELIHNARKHSQASTVSLRLRADASMVDLLYVDDGVGFEEGERVHPPNSGIGLEQIKSRVSTLNGRLELTTSHGKGVRCRIQVPMPSSHSA